MSYSSARDAKGDVEGPEIRNVDITQSLAGYRDIWKLENLLSLFKESKPLPPILSPGLPDLFFGSSSDVNGKGRKDTDKPNFNLPETLISPTLPRTFDSAVAAKFSGDDQTEYNNSVCRIGKAFSLEKASGSPTIEESHCRPSGDGSITKPLTKMASKEAKQKSNFKNASPYSKLKFRSHAVNSSVFSGNLRSDQCNDDEGYTEQHPALEVSMKSYSQSGRRRSAGAADGFLSKHRKVEKAPGQEYENCVKEETTIKDEYTLLPDINTLSAKEIEKYKQQLIKGRGYWLHMTEKVRLYSKKKDPVENMLTSLESFVLHMISCQYDERLQTFSGVLEKEWISLLEAGTDLIAYVKEQISTQKDQKNVLDHESLIKQYYHAFIALLYQANAVVIVRINSILKIHIDKCSKERTNAQRIDRSSSDFLGEQLIALQQNEIDNYITSIRFFEFSRKLSDFLLTFQRLFPSTWESRSRRAIPRSKRISFVPQHDNYSLPIQINSDVREVCALLWHCEQEFTIIYEKRVNSKRKPEYDLYSILNNAL